LGLCVCFCWFVGDVFGWGLCCFVGGRVLVLGWGVGLCVCVGLVVGGVGLCLFCGLVCFLMMGWVLLVCFGVCEFGGYC
jgi:hypothetical protein